MKSSVLRNVLGGLCFLTMVLSFSGCDNPEGYSGRRLVCDVHTVNQGDPLLSGYRNLTANGDLVIITDAVPVIFHARAYGCTVTMPCTNGPYSMYRVTGYDVIWEDVSSRPGLGAVDLPAHNIIGGGANVLVPVNETSAVAVTIVGPDMKDAAWFMQLGAEVIPPFQANARLIFYGNESGSDKVTSTEAQLRVIFVPLIVE